MAALLFQSSTWDNLDGDKHNGWYILHDSSVPSCTDGIVKLRVGDGSMVSGAPKPCIGLAHQVGTRSF
jgi:hypothetical protein